MKLEVRGDEGSGKLGIGGRACAGTPDLWRDVVKFFAILGPRLDRASYLAQAQDTHFIRNNLTGCCSRIGCDDHAAFEDTANNRRSGACGLR